MASPGRLVPRGKYRWHHRVLRFMFSKGEFRLDASKGRRPVRRTGRSVTACYRLTQLLDDLVEVKLAAFWRGGKSSNGREELRPAIGLAPGRQADCREIPVVVGVRDDVGSS